MSNVPFRKENNLSLRWRIVNKDHLRERSVEFHCCVVRLWF
jgi:hypothetical protein